MTIANVLSVAGSDPSGGAGIAADLKTFAALGAYGMAVVSALTVQNTRGVRAIQPVAPEWVGAQLDAVLEDVRVDAIKLGMLADAGIIQAVAARLASLPRLPVVLDPVLRASSGEALLAEDALATLRGELLPRVTLLTPNLHEAAALLREPPARTLPQMRRQALALRALGPRWVLLKGGHLGGGRSPDVLAGAEDVHVFDAVRLPGNHGHGTGCTLSAAIAALLPTVPIPTAVARAKNYLHAALAAAGALQVGQGPGPLHHLHALWQRQAGH